jgi:hypothetical protein
LSSAEGNEDAQTGTVDKGNETADSGKLYRSLFQRSTPPHGSIGGVSIPL